MFRTISWEFYVAGCGVVGIAVDCLGLRVIDTAKMWNSMDLIPNVINFFGAYKIKLNKTCVGPIIAEEALR